MAILSNDQQLSDEAATTTTTTTHSQIYPVFGTYSYIAACMSVRVCKRKQICLDILINFMRKGRDREGWIKLWAEQQEREKWKSQAL